ncbi:MAG: Uma2 family endonuclease [Fimbriimonas sp.]
MEAIARRLPPLEDERFWDLMSRAEEIGMRLEMDAHGIVWEMLPGLRHQEIAAAVYLSVGSNPQDKDCECYRALDVAVRFPDGTVKRPDVAIYCHRPKQEEGFVYEVPEAVIEITSPGYEEKDLVTGPPIYLANGSKDVLVLDRRSAEVHQWDRSGHRVMQSPTVVPLACGCKVTV